MTATETETPQLYGRPAQRVIVRLYAVDFESATEAAVADEVSLGSWVRTILKASLEEAGHEVEEFVEPPAVTVTRAGAQVELNGLPARKLSTQLHVTDLQAAEIESVRQDRSVAGVIRQVVRAALIRRKLPVQELP